MKHDAGGVFGKTFSLQGNEDVLCFTCDHKPHCNQKFWPVDPEWAARSARAEGWVVDEHDDDAPMFCPIHREEGGTPPLVAGEEEVKPRIEPRERIVFHVPGWVATVALIWLSGTLTMFFMGVDLRSQLHSAEFRLMLQGRDDFELKAAIKRADCDMSLPMRCSGLMITDPLGLRVPVKPVRYSCDENHCWFEMK